jgi:hypothetical protein
MSATMKIVALANGKPTAAAGNYVQSFNPDLNEGYGDLVLTERIEDAMRFDSPADAFAFWKKQAAPPYHHRPDGKPNRPLTAFSVEISKV